MILYIYHTYAETEDEQLNLKRSQWSLNAQRRVGIDATSRRRIDVDTTSLL